MFSGALVLPHVRFAPLERIRSEIFTALAYPLATPSLRGDPCYRHRRSARMQTVFEGAVDAGGVSENIDVARCV